MSHQGRLDRVFLGTGLAFPLQLDPAQRFKLVGGDEDISQAIQVILGTAPGERVMRPEFGCRVHELVFAPYDAATDALLVHYVKEALARWEPRIEVKEVRPEPLSNAGRVLIHISYLIKATHDERSIVHPFYIEEEG